ncbi:D-2-hydroxyacid dehydrogenase [Shewanella algae]|uniref:D-2-hydroxyacid dehydrogenase n=1 Tax=Shewanella algae TaxID=38313 RepID=UPI0031F53201
MAYKLLLLTRENAEYRQLLSEKSLPGLTILGDDPANIASADIWLAEPALAQPLLSHGKNLSWLQSTFAGVDKLLGAKTRKDYLLTNVKGIFGPLMSEYVFGYLLAEVRQHALYHHQQQEKYWHPGSLATLQGMKMLILGTGSIGEHLAASAKHFKMQVWGMNRSQRAVAGFDCIISPAQLDELLPQADVVVNTLPSTQESRGLLSKEKLAQLKDSAILFNIGRGDALDLDALVVELGHRNRLKAVLDVFAQEPLSPLHPIWDCPNAVITPHISAPSFPSQVVDIFSRNYHHYLNAESLESLVYFDRGY